MFRTVYDMQWHIYNFSSDPPYAFWINGNDCSASYCYDCALIERGFEVQPGYSIGDNYLDGGWYVFEEDGGLVCARCGCLLAYTLTNYGTEAEITHFVENPPRSLTPDLAYEISTALDSASCTPELAGPAFRVALTALAAIPALPAPSPIEQSGEGCE